MNKHRKWATLSEACWIEHATQQRQDAMRMKGKTVSDCELMLEPTQTERKRQVRDDWEGCAVVWPVAEGWREGRIMAVDISEGGRKVSLLIRSTELISPVEIKNFRKGHNVKVQPPGFYASLVGWADDDPDKAKRGQSPDVWLKGRARRTLSGCGPVNVPIPLDHSKQQAVSVQGREIAALWGPPGTGKTFTLAQICASRLRTDSQLRALVLSISNRAVDVAAIQVDDAWKQHAENDGSADHPTMLPDTPQRNTVLVRARSPQNKDLLREERGHLLNGYEQTVRPYKGRASTLMKQLRAARTSSERVQVLEQLSANRHAMNRALKELYDCARCVFTTMAHVRMSQSIDISSFDLILVDEAGFVPAAALLWVKAQCNGELIVAGDFNQLPAIVNFDPRARKSTFQERFPTREFKYFDSDGQMVSKQFEWVGDEDMRHAKRPIVDAWFAQTVFDMLGVADRLPGGDSEAKKARASAEQAGWFSMLRETRRLPPDICSFVAKQTYGDENALQSICGHRPGPLKCSLGEHPEMLWVNATGHSVRSKKGASSWHNSRIADAAARLALDCVRSEYARNDDKFRVFVLARYRAQATMIRKHTEELFERELEDAHVRAQALNSVQFSTVHKAQGDEADVVIFATVQTVPWYVDGPEDPTWRQELQLCNVVVSRAKRQVVVFIDSNDLDRTNHRYWEAYVQAAQELSVPEFVAAQPGKKMATDGQLYTIRKNLEVPYVKKKLRGRNLGSVTFEEADSLVARLKR